MMGRSRRGMTQSGIPQASVRTSGLGAPEKGAAAAARRGDRAIEHRAGSDGPGRTRAADDGESHAGAPDHMPPGGFADRVGRDLLVTLKVGGDPPRVAEVDVIGVEPIGDAAEAADVLQGVEEPGEPAVPDPSQLGVGHARPGDRLDLGIDQAAGALPRLPRAERDGQAERPGQLAARLGGRDVLRKLLLNDELPVEPARLAPGEDVGQKHQRSVVVVELADAGPGEVNAIELDAVVEGDLDVLGEPDLGRPRPQRPGPSGERAEVALGQGERPILINIADQAKTCVARDVVPEEERLDVVAGGGRDVLHDADRQPTVRMVRSDILKSLGQASAQTRP